MNGKVEDYGSFIIVNTNDAVIDLTDMYHRGGTANAQPIKPKKKAKKKKKAEKK